MCAVKGQTRKPERFLLRIEKGKGLVPFDEATKDRLNAKGYHVGDVLSATLRKARNPGFHRLVFAFARLVVENIPAFEGMTSHGALKRLQIEEDIGCSRMWINMPGVGPVEYRTPDSLAYENMDEGEFNEAFDGFKKAVVHRYWPDLTEEKIHAMAELMG